MPIISSRPAEDDEALRNYELEFALCSIGDGLDIIIDGLGRTGAEGTPALFDALLKALDELRDYAREVSHS